MTPIFDSLASALEWAVGRWSVRHEMRIPPRYEGAVITGADVLRMKERAWEKGRLWVEEKRLSRGNA